MKSIFHLSYNVRDLAETRRFYGDLLQCREGRSAPTWVDYDFFGHQLSLHIGEPFRTERTGKVGDHLVPMPHLGAILELSDWQALADRLKSAATAFVIEPILRFAGKPGEQWIMFFLDPSGNPIEIKGFRSLDGVFQTG
jgi:extradiol dioxygenase family protein